MIIRYPRGIIAALGAAALACTACSDPGPSQRKATVQRVFDEVLNQGRFELFYEAYGPDFVKHVDSRTYSLQEEIAQARATRATASDLIMTVDHLVAEGDWVVVQWTGRGTQDGPWGRVPATGKSFALSGVTAYRFEGERIVEEWTYYNALAALRQLGLAPTE